MNGNRGPDLYGRDKFFIGVDFSLNKVYLENPPNKPNCEPSKAALSSTTTFCAGQIAENGWKMDY